MLKNDIHCWIKKRVPWDYNVKIDHERHASPVGVLRDIQRQTYYTNSRFMHEQIKKINKWLCKWEMQYNIKTENTGLTNAWLEAWSTTATDRDVLGSVSSKATSMFSWRNKGRLTDSLIICHDKNNKQNYLFYNKFECNFWPVNKRN